MSEFPDVAEITVDGKAVLCQRLGLHRAHKCGLHYVDCGTCWAWHYYHVDKLTLAERKQLVREAFAISTTK